MDKMIQVGIIAFFAVTRKLGLVSFSPLKFFYDESAGQVLPVIIVGTVLVVALIISSVASWRKNK